MSLRLVRIIWISLRLTIVKMLNNCFSCSRLTGVPRPTPMSATALLPYLSALILLSVSSLSAQPVSSVDQVPCRPCNELANLALADVRISEAVVVSPDATHCRVRGTIGEEIGFELLLPTRWNARFAMSGGAGFSGSIQNGLRYLVGEGFATVGTNTGHTGETIEADWALNHPQRRLNFGHVAVHRTAVVSKEIIEHYYCAAPTYSYFSGCSRGGGQALIEAQRYPDDFDGIVAAAPIIDWPATGVEFAQNTALVYPDPNQLRNPLLTKEHLVLLEAAVLAQCDTLDGVQDSLLTDPRACALDYAALPRCPDDAPGPECFTTDQLRAIQLIYAGVTSQDSAIYPGFPFGNEAAAGSWDTWIVGPNTETMKLGYPTLQYAIGTGILKNFVYQDSTWDYTDYDFTDFGEQARAASAYLDATSTDYQAFRASGGKMIIYHGWSDPALSAYTSIDHYEAAVAQDSTLSEAVRLFLLPGVLHCGGGPGPSGNNWIRLIQDWVERDTEPERVVVTKKAPGKVLLSRPVFPYPARAVYDGVGDPSVESSFLRKTP